MKSLLSTAAICLTLCGASFAVAQQTTTARTTDNTALQTGSRMMTTMRASELIGHGIVNQQDKSVGEISDLVLDANTGKIRYAAVTYGGFLGVGNKMFAVPYEAFTCKQDPNDKDSHILMLNVTQKQLEGDKGFDDDNWPNFADKEFTTGLDTRYNVNRTRR